MTENNTLLQTVLDKAVDQKKIYGTSFAIKKGSFTWKGASGNLTVNQQYFIASTTKLFTTAIILHLRSKGLLHLHDTLRTYLATDILRGLHIYKGRDYTDQITIRHLLSHTSGLPDYFQNTGPDGKSLEREILDGKDQSWTFEEAMKRTKKMSPRFPPGTQNNAHYSDANFQLLGKIIEVVTQKSYSENCTETIITPLGLLHTYLYTDPTDTKPKTLYYKSSELHIPKAMTSFGADGGMVSTSSDMIVFLEAFFAGQLFPESYIKELQEWNPIFFPIQSGVGIHMFILPRILDPFRTIPELIGHSGLSGALAYYSPREKLYVAGTVNQIAHPDTSFRVMIKLLQTVVRK